MDDRAMQKWAAALRGSKQWTEEQAREVLRHQNASGEGVTAFARRMGFVPQRLFWWRGRLGKRTNVHGEIRNAKTALQFVPVVLREERQGSDVAALHVRIGEYVQVEIRRADASTAAWVALLAAGCANGGLP